MSSNFLQPCMAKPSRIVKYNRLSFIDKIFVNIYGEDFVVEP